MSRKRGFESQDSFESSTSTLPSFCTHQSDSSTLSQGQEQLSYSDRGWSSIFPELTGLNLNNDNDFQPEQCLRLESDGTSSLADIGGANIESWMSQELNEDTRNVEATRLELSRNPWSNRDLICYGMIYRARVKLSGNLPAALEALNDPNVRQTVSGSHFLLDIVFEDGHLYVNVKPGKRLAELNKHLDDSLEALVSSQTICLETVIHKRTLFDDVGSAVKEKDAQTLVNINVYGPASSSFTIGRQFSKQKIWLQRPDWCRPSCTYDNPHVMKFHTLVGEAQSLTIGDRAEQSEEENLGDSLQGVYSRLTRDAHLDSNMVDDSRLRIRLMPHQIKAQKFMVQRETGPIPAQFELWETIHKDDQTWSKHKIAGIKSRSRPTEMGGGILADEMGMGKTFSMLSLIVSSLKPASEWAANPETYLADDILPSKQLSRATLVVVPSPLLLSTWTDEIEGQLKIKLQVFIHHGRDRLSDFRGLCDNDVVLTTYHTLHADYTKNRSPISGVAWYRIILDEAHFVRSPTTHLHKRVAELDAKYRWCLTGTPIQNRLDDIGALFAFLRIYPFDRMNVFRQCITVPFKEGGSRRIAAQENLAKLLDAMCIRRTKALLNLNDVEETTCDVRFTQEERKQYNKTKEDMKRAMQNITGEWANNSRFGMFQAQLQLRLLCNHGTYQHQFHWARARNLNDEREDAASSLAWGDNEGKCSSCQQLIPTVDLVAVCKLQDRCAHMLCLECRQGTGNNCPLCEVTVFRQKHDQSARSSRAIQSREAYFQALGCSSKMDALVQELQKSDPNDKSIVFSHWTSTLDLVGQYFNKHNIYFERIDGNDDLSHRKKTLNKFRNDSSLRILVMTTGVGALGLDLIAANRVHLIEPQWNPSIELQAIGRTLRIGQQRTVKVTRYIVRDSVEQYMQNLQRRKLKMAGMAQTKHGGSSIDDVKVKNETFTDMDLDNILT